MLYSEVQRYVIHINPQKVRLHFSPPPFRAVQTLLLPFDYTGLPWLFSPLAELRYVYGGRWESDAIDFTERGQYRRMLDIFQSLPDYRQSETYQRAMKAVQEGRRFKHKEYSLDGRGGGADIHRTAGAADAIHGGAWLQASGGEWLAAVHHCQ